MCGIIGIAGNEPVSSEIIKGLKHRRVTRRR